MGGCSGSGIAQMRTANETRDGGEREEAGDGREREENVEMWRRLRVRSATVWRTVAERGDCRENYRDRRNEKSLEK